MLNSYFKLFCTLLLLSFITLSACKKKGFLCGEDLNGPNVIECFPSDDCYDRSCVNGTCVTTPKCSLEQICNLKSKTCEQNKKLISKNEVKQKTTTVGRNYHENLIENPGFEDALNSWTRYDYQNFYDNSDCGWSQHCFDAPEGNCQLVWDNICGPNGGYIYQDFELPYTDCVTHFKLSFLIAYNNTATGPQPWIRGNSEIEPIDNLFLGAQSIRVQITTQNDEILEELYDTKDGDPLVAEYMKKEFKFSAKRFSFPLINFPKKLRLRFRITSVQSEMLVLIDDIKLTAKCRKTEHYGRNGEGSHEDKNIDISLIGK